MPRVKLTVSLPEGIAHYLRSTSNASAVVAEAVAEYRDQELERKLEEAYREDASEAERLNREWEATDSEVRD